MTKDAFLTARIPADLHDAIQAVATEQKRTLSDVVRRILQHALLPGPALFGGSGGTIGRALGDMNTTQARLDRIEAFLSNCYGWNPYGKPPPVQGDSLLNRPQRSSLYSWNAETGLRISIDKPEGLE